jgi:hypothetical protein
MAQFRLTTGFYIYMERISHTEHQDLTLTFNFVRQNNRDTYL